MELRHVRYFLAVAGELSFSRAAGRIRVAQPALSRQIHDLEEELGFKLFDRSTAQVRLTEAGRFLQRQAEKLLVQLDLAVTGAQRIAQGVTATLRIGTGWNAAELFVTDAARELHDRNPALAIDFVELPFHEQIPAVRDQRIDVGFVGRERLTPRRDLEFRLIYSGEIKVVLPARHPLASRAAVALRELKDERWITIVEEEIPSFKALLTSIMRPSRFTPKFGQGARSIPGMLACVGTGGGIALLPELLLPAAPAGLRYLVTDGAPYEQFAVWRKAAVEPALSTYLEIVVEKIRTAKIPAAQTRRTR